ncbi:MAG: alpha-amylase, partial [Duncaniella sp.]|nr:alpha-amylase [Duncaniella sp.]
LYDTLRGIQCSNYSAATITNCWQTVEGIQQNMLNFLENHDEQRFGSKFYAGDPAKVIPSLVVSSMISTGPMMIYAGQELGEQATDSEGFSGYDGRTTIFDYWSVPTLRRWYNDGCPDGSQLTPREKWLRQKYSTILGLCNRERAISEGRFYDLMYVNYHNPTLNPHRQYAFLRSCDGVTLIIAVNFSESSCDLAINIPRHAIEMLNIPEGYVTAREMISGDTDVKTISASAPFTTMIGPYDAVVWRIRHQNIRQS